MTLIARLLGPEKQGQYTLIILLPTILYTFLNSGISISTVYFVGIKKYSDQEIYFTNLFFSLALSFFSMVIGLLEIRLVFLIKKILDLFSNY